MDIRYICYYFLPSAHLSTPPTVIPSVLHLFLPFILSLFLFFIASFFLSFLPSHPPSFLPSHHPQSFLPTLNPSFLPYVLPSFLSTFTLYFHPSFLHFCLNCSSVSLLHVFFCFTSLSYLHAIISLDDIRFSIPPLTIIFHWLLSQVHVQAVSVYAELKRPTVPRFAIVCTLAMFFCCTAYSFTACFGYLTFGQSLKGDFLLNYDSGDVMANIARVVLALIVLSSYATCAFCGR